MKKHIWIMNHYAGAMLFDRGGRHYNFAKYLKREDCEPVIFCCNSKHGKAERFYESDALWHEHVAAEIGVPFVFVRGRTYQNNGKQRVLNMVDFYRNVQKAAKEYAARYDKPDVIIASSVHPLTLVAGIRLAKYFGVECICEVRDLWPESIVEYSNRFTKENPLIKLLYRGEKWIYKKADKLLFTMEGGYDYIVEQGWEQEIPRSKVFHINNGVDLRQFDENRERFRLADDDLDDPNIRKVVYTGSIRKANDSVPLLPDIAEHLSERGRDDVRLIVFGDGDVLPELHRICEERHLDNLVFKGAVEKKYVPSILSRADVNILNFKGSEILRFGGSQNKLFDYLASGKPIISGQDDAYSIVRNENCGISKRFSNADEIVDAILSLLDGNIPSGHIRSVGEQYDFAVLTRKLLDVIEGVEPR